MGWELKLGDAYQQDFGDFDCFITDPPYREAVHARATSHSKVRGARHRDMGFEHLTDLQRHVIAKMAARAKRWIVIFSDLESVGKWQEALEMKGAHYIRTIPWVRWSMPQLSGDRPPQGAEAIVVAYGHGKGRKHWNAPGNLTHCAHKCLRGEGKHKAEKPLDLCLDLVDWFSDPGEHIVDPFAGHATIGLACRLFPMRHYTGCEIDREWHEKATARLVDPLSERDRERRDRFNASRTVTMPCEDSSRSS